MRTKVDCLADIAEVVDISSKLNKPQLVGSENGPSEVPVYQWDTFLAQYFKKVPKIKSYQHFHVDSSGELYVQEHCKSPKLLHKIINVMPNRETFPDIVPKKKNFELKTRFSQFQVSYTSLTKYAPISILKITTRNKKQNYQKWL